LEEHRARMMMWGQTTTNEEFGDEELQHDLEGPSDSVVVNSCGMANSSIVASCSGVTSSSEIAICRMAGYVMANKVELPAVKWPAMSWLTKLRCQG
jgi:hypothetical protein